MRSASDAPYYRYDPKIGDAQARFVPTAVARPEFGRPEMPAAFVAIVEGETHISSMWGGRAVPWRAEPGTSCVILGYWTDDTVRVSWPAIEGAYRVDGRFPAWVVVETPTAPMAAGGHILKANNPPVRRGPVKRLTHFIAHILGGLHAS
jgi:hypothetical protein